VELRDEKDRTLVSYHPYRLQHPELPEVQERPALPGEVESVEDLYLTGRFVEQFSRPGYDPDDYYQRALNLSPEDYRVNIALGIRRVNQWKFEEAEEYLNKAADKLRVRYYQPKEGELFYYLGLAQLALGKEAEAYRNLSRSTWYYEWLSSGFYQLALIESKKGDYDKALEYITRAYANNNHDGRILILYSALLRRSGETDQAMELMNELIDYDPINFAAYYEKALISGNHSIDEWERYMQDVDNNYLEIAVNYMNAGMLDEGIRLLSSLENPSNPLVEYYLAWFHSQNNQPEESRKHLSAAEKISVDYCFPYRRETLEVLKFAIAQSPDNAIPYYLLGNLLYDKRPEDAIQAWNEALEADENFGMVRRNLAFGAFYHQNDAEKAIEYIKKAIEINSDQAIWYAEMENYFDHSDADFRECLGIMASHIEVVKKDINAPKSLVKLYNLNGEYDKAIDLLDKHHFRTWEGGRSIYYHYVDAHTLKAREFMKNGNMQDAIQELEKAMLYPENLEVGKPLNDERNAMIYYYMGRAYEQLNKKSKAKECFEKSVKADNSTSWPDLLFYQAMSDEKLGNTEKAQATYRELIAEGDIQLERGRIGSGIGVEESSVKSDIPVSEAYYLKALGTLGLGNKDEAKMLFDEALKAYKNNLWATVHKQATN